MKGFYVFLPIDNLLKNLRFFSLPLHTMTQTIDTRKTPNQKDPKILRLGIRQKEREKGI